MVAILFLDANADFLFDIFPKDLCPSVCPVTLYGFICTIGVMWCCRWLYRLSTYKSACSHTTRSLNAYIYIICFKFYLYGKKVKELVIIRRIEYWLAGLQYPSASLVGCRAGMLKPGPLTEPEEMLLVLILYRDWLIS